MFPRLYCTLTEHWWTRTLASTPHLPRKRLEGKVRTTYWQTKCNPALQGSLEAHSALGISKDKLIFRFEAHSVCQTQSVNWQTLAGIPVSPSLLYLLHGNSQLCFQPSLCCSPNTNGIIFFQFLWVAQRMTAASVGKTICKEFESVNFWHI